MNRTRTVRLLIVPALFIALMLIPPNRTVALKNLPLRVLSWPLSLFSGIYYRITSVGSLFDFYLQYTQYQQELAQLRATTYQFEELRQENERLRALLELPAVSEHRAVVARVIGRDPGNWLSTVLIGKGKKDGLFVNQPVMLQGTLLGKTIEVAGRTAKVLLITDVNSRVVALAQRSRQEGLLVGSGQGLCRLNYLPVDADVALGDVVVTAGSGGVYPKGLAVGTVESIRVDRGGLYKSCIVRPFMAQQALEEVICLKSDFVSTDL